MCLTVPAMDLPAPPDERTTLDLVQRMQRGEDAAWRDLYDRFRDELLLAIRSQLGPQLRSALQSEDVLQSVALEAFRQMPGFEDRGRGSLRGFLHLLVRRKVIDQARAAARGSRGRTTPLTDSVADGAAAPLPEPLYRDPRYLHLERALAALPEDLREIIRLRRFEGLSSKEAAAVLGRSDAATRKLHSRAVARLTLLMEPPAA